MSHQPDPNLSEKQLDVYHYIIAHVSVHGFQPNMEEMGKVFGVSRNAIHGRLKELERRGFIELPNNRERSIVLLNIQFQPFMSKGAKPLPGEVDAKLEKFIREGTRTLIDERTVEPTTAAQSAEMPQQTSESPPAKRKRN